eukprot:UN12742
MTWTKDKMEYLNMAEEIIRQKELQQYEAYRMNGEAWGFRIRGDGDSVDTLVTFVEEEIHDIKLGSP